MLRKEPEPLTYEPFETRLEIAKQDVYEEELSRAEVDGDTDRLQILEEIAAYGFTFTFGTRSDYKTGTTLLETDESGKRSLTHTIEGKIPNGHVSVTRTETYASYSPTYGKAYPLLEISYGGTRDSDEISSTEAVALYSRYGRVLEQIDKTARIRASKGPALNATPLTTKPSP
jgi:hypothetical protein